MRQNYLHQITSKVESVFNCVDGVDDDEVKSHLARYLCVLTSGYLEESIRILVQDYVNIRAHPTVFNYVNAEIRFLTNFNIEKIEQFLNCFNSAWKDQFSICITDEEKDAVNSLVANRHRIAHGHDVGVSYVQAKKWYKCTKEVVRKLNTIIQ